MSTLETLLEPKSVAIVGASREREKLGNIIVANIQAGGYQGKIFPVNPRASDVNGLACYASYRDIPEAPDLAIIAIPAEAALATLPEIVAKGTKSFVILSANFKEAGLAGAAREEKLRAMAESFGLRIIGPNCLGFINNDCKLNATFGQALNQTGPLRYISQSGAIATAIFDWAKATGVGFSSCITLGNKTVINENYILEYFLQKEKTGKHRVPAPGESRYEPIGLYLESISNGLEFIQKASHIARTHPVFILKPGKSTAAKAAMRSHTGAMASDDAVLDTALRESGVIRCDGMEDFFDLSRTFAWENAPRGPRVAIVSNAGGPGVLTTDAVAAEGLTLASIGLKAKHALEAALPPAANMHNPIDVLGDALCDRYVAAMEAVLAEDQVDALVVLLTPQVMTQIQKTAEGVARMSARYKKTIVCSFMGGTQIEVGERMLNDHKIPSFRFPERAVKALGAMYRWEAWRHSTKEKDVRLPRFHTKAKVQIEKILAQYKGMSVPGVEANRIAALCGLTVPKGGVVKSHEECKHLAHAVDYPVVLKISSRSALHKTEMHGVIPNINTPSELTYAFDTLQKVIRKTKDKEAVIELQKQIVEGIEVIVGMKRDSAFGPVLMLGAGGILTELVADKNLAVSHIHESELENLIQQSKVGKLLQGYRGSKPYAIDELAEVLLRLRALAHEFHQIREIEINPIIVTHKSALAVDTKIVVQ